MPLMPLDTAPHGKGRFWPFLTVSFALHAVLLGLGVQYFEQEPEMRFFASGNSLSVSLVASGAKQEKADGKEAVGQGAEVSSVKDVEHTSTLTMPLQATPRKKQARPKKTKPVPKPEPAIAHSAPEKKQAARGEDAPHNSQGAAVERTIGEGNAPSFARFVPPEYPHQARARNMEGRVLLRVLVGAEGRAKEIEVVESSHPAFTKAARRSAQRSRYVPFIQQGRAEDVWVLIPFQFKLK